MLKNKRKEVKIINTSYIETISDGEKDFIHELIETFSSTYTLLCKDIKDAYDNKDFVQLGRFAHQLKPSIKMLELPCSEAIVVMKEKPESTTPKMISQIEKECQIAEDQLKKWVDSL